MIKKIKKIGNFLIGFGFGLILMIGINLFASFILWDLQYFNNPDGWRFAFLVSLICGISLDLSDLTNKK